MVECQRKYKGAEMMTFAAQSDTNNEMEEKVVIKMKNDISKLDVDLGRN